MHRELSVHFYSKYNDHFFQQDRHSKIGFLLTALDVQNMIFYYMRKKMEEYPWLEEDRRRFAVKQLFRHLLCSWLARLRSKRGRKRKKEKIIISHIFAPSVKQRKEIRSPPMTA